MISSGSATANTSSSTFSESLAKASCKASTQLLGIKIPENEYYVEIK